MHHDLGRVAVLLPSKQSFLKAMTYILQKKTHLYLKGTQVNENAMLCDNNQREYEYKCEYHRPHYGIYGNI